METIKRGSHGEVVKVLQHTLSIAEDGIFGDETALAVKNFQMIHGLVPDGIVGPKTWAELLKSAPIEIGLVECPRSYEDVYRIFGDPDSSGWESKNLAFCAIEDAFAVFPRRGDKRGFTCNKKLIPIFQSVFSEILANNLADQIYSYDGCFNNRNISGSSRKSLHAWGIAIDINYEGNELGDTTPAMNLEIVATFKKHGFFWGGDYQGRKDPMHYEFFDRT